MIRVGWVESTESLHPNYYAEMYGDKAQEELVRYIKLKAPEAQVTAAASFDRGIVLLVLGLIGFFRERSFIKVNIEDEDLKRPADGVD